MKKLFYRSPMFDADTGAGGISDIAGLDTLLDNVNNPQGTDVNTNPPEPTTNTNQANNTQQNQTPPTVQQPEQSQQSSANAAFAQMRVANKQLSDMLEKVAKANGVEYTDLNDLMNKMNNDVLAKQAKQQNVPLELLQRLNLLEETQRAREQEQLKTATIIGFQKLKTTYNLTDEQLKDYAAELDRDGLNPFIKQLDIEKDYKTRHFDDIVNLKIQEAVKQALATNSQANNHSTTPNNTQGTGSNGAGDTVSTVSQLDMLLNNIK